MSENGSRINRPSPGKAPMAALPLPLPLPPPERPVLLAGPTASGKSALALALARAQGRVVVNADALQVHDAFRILTARPDDADLAAAPHALYGHVPRGAAYSVGHWLREVAPLLVQTPAPVIVGGTGLYFTALTRGLATIPPIPPQVRAEADGLRAEGGLAALLPGLDAHTAAGIDLANPARVQRAWEVLRATGRGLAAWQDQTGPPLLPEDQAECWLLDPGAALQERIVTRFDAMLAAGAMDEVRAALPHWPDPGPESLGDPHSRASLGLAGAGQQAGIAAAAPAPPPLWTKAIGAPELVAHLRHQMSLAEARESAILATRHYAKRQRTWFRNRLTGWRRLDAG
jgi:tRNA dimethylallyltransferase